ncbi:hypothetical protein O2N63_04545 [Aliiroseovarius sp. KMU-50]|uniref:Short-chain dehydrogenase n=1 Tax=Aliiroseovarius salicola TaxID=3009082 RepID=A0ABT4VYR3_9RHOB|nr:hypothetical protein [Aliiroseovarius sp. KMU-50]MDA5093351.1 hypothetical protein [Aliiroseovarius sp. KMU-50]
MVIKIVVLFLVAMGVLAMFGKLRYPGQKRVEAMKCPRCGRFLLGKSAKKNGCDCKGKG